MQQIQHHRANYYPVYGKRGKAVLADIGDNPAHYDQSADKGGDEADSDKLCNYCWISSKYSIKPTLTRTRGFEFSNRNLENLPIF